MHNYLKYIALKDCNIMIKAPELYITFSQSFKDICAPIKLCTKKQLKLINTFSKVAVYMLETLKLIVFLHTSKE